MRIELGVAIISGVVAIGSAMVAYMAQTNVVVLQNEFRATHEKELATINAKHEKELALLRSQLKQQHERQKPFLERQMAHYFQATEAASKIANMEDVPSRREAIARFWLLYWGPLAVVEDAAVERAMVNFGNALRSESPDRVELQQLSLDLAHACRDSLQKLWGTDLGQLHNLRATK
jgi:hypothetical protein